jgi:hypothetical protein
MVYLKIEKLFDAFLKEKQFLCGASPATVRIYSKSWAAYKRYAGCTCEITGTGSSRSRCMRRSKSSKAP